MPSTTQKSTAASLQEALAKIREQGRWRQLRTMPGTGGVFQDQGRRVLNFASNDYLNLATDPRLKAAGAEALERHGCGATASRLVVGTLPVHGALESALASLTGQERALVFASGYQANIGVITALAGKGDILFSDALNHASIIDGARLSRAEIAVYPHCDMEALESRLCAAGGYRRRIIVSDAVFSMDGDLAPVEALAELAARHDALLLIDEAHALGVFGRGGGLCAERGVTPDVIIGTLSKALGSGGGFAAASGEIIDLLVNSARSFIFSTGLAPAPAASALRAVEILRESPELGATLLQRARRFQDLLHAARPAPSTNEFSSPSHSASQVIPLLLGDNARTLRAAEQLAARGLLTGAIRPPSVPEGTARLRLAVTLAHEEAELQEAATHLAEVLWQHP